MNEEENSKVTNIALVIGSVFGKVEQHFAAPVQQEKEIINKGNEADEPLRNLIFHPRLFDSNKRLEALRSVIAAAIDLGDASATYGEPQELRINPQMQNEWYYIVKALEEAHICREFKMPEFVEQIHEWFPSLFAEAPDQEWEKQKRRLSKSISDERGKWKELKTGVEITLREMWAKERSLPFDHKKMERIYAIAYQGLLQRLLALKQDIEKARG